MRTELGSLYAKNVPKAVVVLREARGCIPMSPTFGIPERSPHLREIENIFQSEAEEKNKKKVVIGDISPRPAVPKLATA